MLYLLFVLTFLAGILFYGLSPHDKGLDMTAHQAEGMIVTFLAQHQAAKDYLYKWLGADDTETTGNLQNGTNFSKADNNGVFDLRSTMPRELTTDDMCSGNNGVPGQNTCRDDEGNAIPGFVSQVVDDGAKHYVITYGGWEGCTDQEKQLVATSRSKNASL